MLTTILTIFITILFNYLFRDIINRITMLNPYSVLTPPGGVPGLLKIIHFTNIFLFIACKIRKYLIFTQKATNMSDAVRVKTKNLPLLQ